MPGVRYSVYRRKDDLPVAISKNRVQCAMAMGISVEGFDSYVSRNRNQNAENLKRAPKWEIIREVQDV